MHKARFRAFATLLAALVWAAAALPAAAARPQSQIDSRGMDLFDAGQAAHAEGRLDEALKLYGESIALDPEFWGSHYQRGVALLQLERPAEAAESLARAVELEREFAAAHAALGDALLRLDRPADAEKELARALAIEPALSGARINYANALWRRKAFAEADRELARVAAERRATPDSEFLHAEVLAGLGRPADALAAYGRALALDPGHVAALHGRGLLRAKSGDVAGAIEDLSAAYRLRPSRDLEAALADLQGRAKAPDAVVDAFRARAAADPNDREARRALAESLARAGRTEEARRELDRLLAETPDDAAAFEMAGDLVSAPAPEEAARYYAGAARLAPENVDYRVKLGGALVRSGKYAEAFEHLQLAAAKAPDRREAHAGLAAAYYGTGQYAEAAREFGWLAERDPAAPGIQFFLGASLDRVGDCRGAIDAFRRFLAAADPVRDKRKIEDVNLRLPAIERQVERDGCRKKK